MAIVYTGPVPVAFFFFPRRSGVFSEAAGCPERNSLHLGRKRGKKKRGNGEGEEMIECGRKVVTLLWVFCQLFLIIYQEWDWE